MGRTDTTGGEHIVVPGPQGIQGLDDLVGPVADRARLQQVDAEGRKKTGDGVQIGVARAAGQNLVADDQDRGGGGDVAHPP